MNDEIERMLLEECREISEMSDEECEEFDRLYLQKKIENIFK